MKRPLGFHKVSVLIQLVVCALVQPVAAQDKWPDRAVSIVVPGAPGGTSDPLARLLSEELGKELGQTVIVVNKPGANGNIGAATVAKAPADGYTLLLSWTGTIVSSVTLYQKSKPFDPRTDFEPIVLVGSVPNILVVNKDLPVSDLADFLRYVRKHPGKLAYGSVGSGSSWHLAADLIKKSLAIDMTHVPYTSPGHSITDLLAGQIQVAAPGITPMIPLLEEGRLRGLALLDDKRFPALPNIPSMADLGYPDIVAVTWMALLAPKGTSREIVMKINRTINKAIKSPGFLQRLTSMGYSPMGGTPEYFADYMNSEISKWGSIIEFSGAKVE